jgi:hypothetical protein
MRLALIDINPRAPSDNRVGLAAARAIFPDTMLDVNGLEPKKISPG